MGEFVQVTAQDGHELSAYVAKPGGEIKGGIVLVQEIFGVNAHIRNVADSYARDGYVVVAPALFDRQQRGVELTYEGEDMQKAYALYGGLSPETALLDVAAAFKMASAHAAKVGVIGFCYGGLMSWLSATRGPSVGMEPACCVAYYPGGIGSVATEKPSCPVLVNFGANDSHIGADQREALEKAAHAEVKVYVYKGADHGFNCDMRSAFNPEASALARQRTDAFLMEQLG